MWLQAMPIQPMTNVSKSAQSTQGNTVPSSAGAAFETLLQASLGNIDAPPSGTAPTSVQQPLISDMRGKFSTDTLLEMLQDWLVNALQPLMSHENENNPNEINTMNHLSTDQFGGKQFEGFFEQMPFDTELLVSGTQDIPYELMQWLLNVLETVPESLTIRDLFGSNVMGINDVLRGWLNVLSKQPTNADMMESNGATIPWLRSFLTATDNAEINNEDVPIENDQETQPVTVGVVREMLNREISSQTGLRSGIGQDGNSGRATPDSGMMNLPPGHGQWQAVTGSERTFAQWLNQNGEMMVTEGSSSVRETNEFFPTVRLLLTRFETLDGRGYEARFQLYPEQLGTVHVKLILHQGTLQAQLLVDTQLAKEALESQLQQLQQAFVQQGLQVDKIQVTVRDDALFQWHEQTAFLYQEQRENARQGAQDGQSSASSRNYMIDEIEGTQEDAEAINRDTGKTEGINVSV